MRCLISAITLLFASATLSFAEQIVLNVSPGASANGRNSFGNVEEALAHARTLRQAQPSNSVSILLASGRYELLKPLDLGVADSGSSEATPFELRAAPGARPILSGGKRITGFSRSDTNRNLWQVKIPEVLSKQWYFSELFVDGLRAKRARTPNTGFFRIDGPGPRSKPATIKFKGQDIKKEWADAGDVELVALLAWADLRMQIKSVDAVNRVAVLSGDARPSNQESDARYYIENARDALDEPGEFYLDRSAGVLSYFAREDQDMGRAEVIAPRLRELVVIRGDSKSGRAVEHVLFSGITFSDTDWSLPEAGYADTQAAVAIRGTLLAEGVRDLRIENCTFTHLAGYAIELGKGAQNCKILRNEIVDCGAGGIRVGEGAKRSELFDQNFGHEIADNQIHHSGVIYPSAVGIFIMQSGTNHVAHNHIHHLFYTAISVGWNWGYQETPCRENVIEYNDLHDIGQGMLSDMGAIYTLGIQKRTVVRNNRIHDIQSWGYGGWGLYPDEGSSDIIWENNLVYRCKSAGFHQHYGKDNIVRNNIFALNAEHELMRTREETHRSFVFTNNIVYSDSGDLLGSNWSNDQFTMDSNLYFDARTAGKPEALKFGNSTFAEWKARGHDTNSIVVDPLFVAPSAGDFHLKANSPALKIGFRSIDFESIGPRSNPGAAQ